MRNLALILVFASCVFSACSNTSKTDHTSHEDGKIEPNIVEKLFDSQNSCFRSGIVGGTAVTAENPRKKHVALLMVTDHLKQISVCTAVLISKNVLLTAAHCAEEASIQVYFHHSSLCSDGMNSKLVYKVNQAVIHPYWAGNPDSSTALQQANNDLALLKLEKDAPAGYQPVAFAKPQELNQSTEILQIGYGKTATQVSRPPVLNEVFKNKKDIEYLDYSGYLVVKQASHGGCSGDSGGPLLVKSNGSYKVLGIASFLIHAQSAATVCETGSLAYDSVAEYLPWIQETLKQLK